MRRPKERFRVAGILASADEAHAVAQMARIAGYRDLIHRLVRQHFPRLGEPGPPRREPPRTRNLTTF